MFWRTFAISSVALAVAIDVTAATINFRATKKTGASWACAAANESADGSGLTIRVIVDNAPAGETVKLQAVYDNAGASATGALTFDKPNNSYVLSAPGAAPAAGSAVTVTGNVGSETFTCAASVPAEESEGTAAAVSGRRVPEVRYADIDFRASEWLAGPRGKAAVQQLLTTLREEFPSLKRNGIVLLRHLPSGAPAFPFASSVSEHQTIQIATVVDRRSTVGSVDVTMTACERPLRERMKGDFGSLAAKPQGIGRLEPDFALLPIGTLIQCGPDEMRYTMSVTPADGSAKPEPTAARLEVRPVYHVGATAFMGFDSVKKPEFSVQSGVVTRQTDAFGTGFFVGATWYPFGVDYGRMRWWNYVVNPFGGVSMDAPKENFIVGNAFTVTGGISLAVGAAIHRLDELNGIAEGAAFTGDGTVPTRKAWSKKGVGWYIGVAVDNNVLTAFRKLGSPAAGGK